MPKAFDSCRASGGKIRTVKPSKATYKPICIKSGKVSAGHTHQKKAGRGR